MKPMVGIIGGMGALAGLRLVEYALTHRRFDRDDEYPKLLFYNLPISGMSEKGIEDPKKVLSQLRGTVERMESFGCRKIVLACNTVHCFHRKLQGMYSGELIDMPAVACASLNGETTVGLLTSQTTKETRLYSSLLKDRDVIETDVEEQVLLNKAIKSVITGNIGPPSMLDVRWIVSNMKVRGAQAILIGCTEVPALFNGESIGVPVIDAGRCAIDVALS